MDRHIDGYYRHFLGWLDGWLDVVDGDRDFDLLVTRHEDLMASETGVIETILRHYGLSAELKLVPKDKGTHFRAGDNHSWRADLTGAQLRRVNDLMPSRFWSRFGWEP